MPYDQMYRILKDAIEKYGKPPMLIIHKSSPYVIDEELKAIHDIIQEYSDLQYSIMHLAVHIKGDTIYRLYDFGASDLSVNRGMALVDKFRQNNWRIILFTTGRGTPAGNVIALVIKITANSDTYDKLHDIIDVYLDMSKILKGLRCGWTVNI